MKKETTKCLKCLCELFHGHQVVHMGVKVTGDGEFAENEPDVEAAIYDADKPFGPFTCVKCGAEYETLPIVVDIIIGEKSDEELDLVAEAVKVLQESEHDMDEVIHDLCSKEASRINNGGLEAQARFLLGEYGGDLDTIKSILEQVEVRERK